MSKSKALPLTIRALSRWPADILRPEVQFKEVLLRRAKGRASDTQKDETAELEQANALCSLLENRYLKKYQIAPNMIKPASNPTYYEDLVADLQAAPSRSWFQAWLTRLGGMVRFS